MQHKIREALNALHAATGGSFLQPETLSAMCRVYREAGFQCHATGGNEYAALGWLYDAVCLRYRGEGDDRYLDRVGLVAECEYGRESCVWDDFEKLLIARSDLRVMVFNGQLVPWCKTFRAFRNSIAACAHSLPGDAWLLAAWTPEGWNYDSLPDTSVEDSP